jgi:hypothetical protein
VRGRRIDVQNEAESCIIRANRRKGTFADAVGFSLGKNSDAA